MQIVLSLLRRQAAVALAAALLLLPTRGQAQTLFPRHQVTVEFATADGKPLADAEVRIFAPGETGRPAVTGRTDSTGHFEFGADRDGFWSAEARNGDEIARVTIRVGGKGDEHGEPSPYWVLAGLVLLLALALAYRTARRRLRRPRP